MTCDISPVLAVFSGICTLEILRLSHSIHLSAVLLLGDKDKSFETCSTSSPQSNLPFSVTTITVSVTINKSNSVQTFQVHNTRAKILKYKSCELSETNEEKNYISQTSGYASIFYLLYFNNACHFVFVTSLS